MKRVLILFLTSLLLASCGHECCDEKHFTDASSGTKMVGDTSNISCKLTSADLQRRKETVLATLKSKVLERKELSDGYSLKFDNTDEMIDMLTAFVKSERQCCDFFNFSIQVRNDGSLWFDITGPKGAKEMIDSEMAL